MNGEITKIDSELHLPVKLAAANDGLTMKEWLSNLIRDKLNKRAEHALDIKPLKVQKGSH